MVVMCMMRDESTFPPLFLMRAEKKFYLFLQWQSFTSQMAFEWLQLSDGDEKISFANYTSTYCRKSSSECATHINCIKCWQLSPFFGFVIRLSLKIPECSLAMGKLGFAVLVKLFNKILEQFFITFYWENWQKSR